MAIAKIDDTLDMYYEVDDFTDPWTQPETIVLHHGMAKNHKMWFGWVPILARHYRVIRFDMRGMGQSAVPEPGYLWSLDNFANDLLIRIELTWHHVDKMTFLQWHVALRYRRIVV